MSQFARVATVVISVSAPGEMCVWHCGIVGLGERDGGGDENVEKYNQVDMSSGERVFQVLRCVHDPAYPAYIAAGSCGSATACIT